jgi:hypothetical protein
MGEWVTTLGGWASRKTAMYAYGDQSFQTGLFGGYQRYHRLYGRQEHDQALHAVVQLHGRPRRRAQLRLGEVHRPAVPARRPHAGADDAAQERDQPVAVRHGAGGVRERR